ncbi:MAG TPA: hypothetical protein VF516_34360 [Kofleriaceae bacterium]
MAGIDGAGIRTGIRNTEHIEEIVTINETTSGESELQSRMAMDSLARDIYVRTRLCPMRGRIVTTARAHQVHVIAARAALTHDETRRHGKTCSTCSNGVLPGAHCANHRVRRCGRLRDAPFSRVARYQIYQIYDVNQFYAGRA